MYLSDTIELSTVSLDQRRCLYLWLVCCISSSGWPLLKLENKIKKIYQGGNVKLVIFVNYKCSLFKNNLKVETND